MKSHGDIELTSLRRGDSRMLFKWINTRPDVLLSAPYKPVHERSHDQWFETVRKRPDAVIFAIRMRLSGKLIGYCQLHDISLLHRSAELQIRLGDAAERGKGYGSQATRALVEFAFTDLNLRRVYLHVLSTNTAAVGMYRMLGFSKEGQLREAVFIGGRYVDLVLMSILKREDRR